MKKMTMAVMVVLAVFIINCQQSPSTGQTTHLVATMTADSPRSVPVGKAVTVAEFELKTNKGSVNLYDFITKWDHADRIAPCSIVNVDGKKLDVTQSGHRPQGSDELDLTFFFMPSSGVNPGKDYDYVTVGTQPTTFKVVCDIAAPVSGLEFTLREVIFQERDRLAGHLLQTKIDAH